MKNTKIKINRKQSGFTLLISMIVTSLVLAIGFSIGSIILKELALSASGKRSQIAFYAADSIAECARYWDRKDVDGFSVDNSLIVTQSPFATSSSGTPFIRCGTGIDPNDPGRVEGFIKDSDLEYATSSFFAIFTNPADPTTAACGKVTIIKSPPFNTTIEARGYNVGYTTGIGCDTSNPKAVERGLRITY